MEHFKKLTYNDCELEVGDCGTIRKNGTDLHQITTYDGYKQVYYGKGSIKTHRLVAMAFCDGRSKERNEVNHIDFNRTNNHADNLEWVTHEENIRHSIDHYRSKDIYGEKNPNYGNHTLHDRYLRDPGFAKEKQSRPGTQNGRATAVSVYQGDVLIGTFPYLGECWEYMRDNHGFDMSTESFRSGIRRANKLQKTYKGFTFIKS